MSAEHVRTILTRAVKEPEFRGLLFRDPGQALAGYELTDAEAAALRGLTPENFDSLAGELEQRLSHSVFGIDAAMSEQKQKVGPGEEAGKLSASEMRAKG